MQRMLLAASILALVAGSAGAQEPGRYQLEKSGNGWIRLDRDSGAVSFCEEKAGGIVCRAAADERDALLDEVARLERRLAAVEDTLAKLDAAPPPAPGAAPPTEEEFEQTLGTMERFLRRFMGIVKDLERDYGGGTKDADPAPDRT